MNQNKKDAFELMSVPRALATFIIPTVLSQLVTIIYNLADTFFVGHTGDNYQIAALTITFPIYMFMTCIGTMFGVGANATISAALGVKNTERATKLSTFSIYTAGAFIGVIAIILAIVKTPFLTMMGANSNTLSYCNAYVFWTFIIGSIPTVCTQVFSQLFLAEGRSKLAGIGVCLGGILNIILDPLFIFYFGLGIKGAAIATCISNYCALLFFIVSYIINRNNSIISLNIKKYTVSNDIAKSVLLIGIPAGLALLLTNISDVLRNHFMGTYGTDVDIAAYGVMQKVGNTIMQTSIGISQGVRPLVAYSYSAKQYKRMKSFIKHAIVIMLIFVSLSVSIIELFPSQIVKIFINTSNTIPVAASFLKTWIACQFGLVFAELLVAFFQAMGKWQHNLVLTSLGKGVFQIASLLILVAIFGKYGVIYNQPISETMFGLITVTTYIYVMKKLKLN